MLQGHLCLRGNAFCFIERNAFFEPTGLIPLKPWEVEVMRRKDGTAAYRYRGDVLRADQVLHLRGLSSDGYIGLSPIGMMREAIGLSLATEGHGARLFSSGARPSGILEHPGSLGPEAAKSLREGFDAQNSGTKSGRTIVLEEGMKWQAVTMTSDDAQFLETRKFQISEIARAFRVPPHMIGDLDKATFSNIEHQGIEFVQHTMRPWVVRWEQALNRTLLTEEDKAAGFYFAFSLNALQRGDMKSRYEAYAIARTWGWFNADDVRQLEDMNDLPDGKGKIYLQPLNMIEAGAKAPEPAAAPAAPAAPAGDDETNSHNGHNGHPNGANRLQLKF